MQLLLGYGLQFLKRKYNGLATPIPFLRFLNLREIQKFVFEAAYIHTYTHTYIHTYFIATLQRGFFSYKVINQLIN